MREDTEEESDSRLSGLGAGRGGQEVHVYISETSGKIYTNPKAVIFRENELPLVAVEPTAHSTFQRDA